jgi:hypothetical protein
MIKVGKSEFYAEIWNINEDTNYMSRAFRDEFSRE